MRYLALLFALGLATATAADSPVVCTETPASVTSCSATSATATVQISCTCSAVAAAALAGPLDGFFTSFWKLADTSDSIGSLTLTNNGGVTFGAGKIGNAATFVSASSQSLSRATVTVSGPSFTLVAWVKFTTTNPSRGIIALGSNNAGSMQITTFSDSSGKVCAYTNVSGIAVSASPLNDGNWHLLVAYHDAVAHTNTLIVDNGTPVSVAAASDVGQTGTITIGRHPAGGYFDGSIDAAGYVDNKIPSAAQITAMWNAGAGAEPPF